MFHIKNNQVSVNKTKTLSPKQLSQYNRLNDADKTWYMLSLMGIIKRRVYIDRIKCSGDDILKKRLPNSVLLEVQKLQRIDREHKPYNTSPGQWTGVEIECLIPENDRYYECTDECDHDNDDCQAQHVNSHNWLKNKIRRAGILRCQVKGDGSVGCDDGGTGVEVTILFNSKYGFGPLEKLCQVLIDAGCYVNKTCGLHVHLDARDLDKDEAKRVGHSIGNSLPVIKWLVPETRHKNTYCKLGVSRMTPRACRYYAVNLVAFRKFKTVEIRLHAGSINASKIANWINLLRLIGNAGLTQPLKTFQDLLDLGLPDSLVQYAEKRITELNPTAWTKLTAPETAAPTTVLTQLQNGEAA